MGKIKLRIAVIALVAALVSLINPLTLAYYQVVGQTTNVITSGNLELIINEMTDQGTPFPEEGVYVVPGDVVSKKVSVSNNCDHPFYVRVKPIYGVEGEELPADECFKVNINEEYWEYHDGWYYYKAILDPYATTPFIFSHVEIVGDKVDNRYIGKTLTLTVRAQMVQSDNNPLIDDKIYTASGWPVDE